MIRIAYFCPLEFSFARRILQGFLAYKQAHREWSLILSLIDSEKGAEFPWEPEAICAIGSDSIPALSNFRTKRRVFIGGEDIAIREVRIECDNNAVGRMAAQFFKRRGMIQVGIVTEKNQRYSQDRFAGFAAEAEASGLTLHEFKDSPANNHSVSKAEWKLRWLRELPKPVGIFATNDFCALEIGNTCAVGGLQLPREIALLGVDNSELLCETCPVSLSSIDNGTFRMGWEAAAILHRWTTTGEAPRKRLHLIQPTELIQRASTAGTAIEDPLLKRALRFIEEESCNGISVADVARHAAINRRTLERRFRQALNHGIHQEIQLCRVDAAKRWLTRTDLSVNAIAECCNLGSSSELSHLFKRKTGLSPTNYRAQHAPAPGHSR